MANSDENSDRNAADEEKSEKNDSSESKVVVSKQQNNIDDNNEAKSENDNADEDDNHSDPEVAQQAKHRLISIIPKNHNQDEDQHNKQNQHHLVNSNQSQHQHCYHRHNQHHHKHNHGHNHHHHHHHHHHHSPHNDKAAGHVKELIKPDPTIKAQIARSNNVVKSPKTCEREARLRVATVVDEEQLHKRFVDQRSNSLQKLTYKSPSERLKRSTSPKLSKSSSNLTNLEIHADDSGNKAAKVTTKKKETSPTSDNSKVNSSKKSSSSSSDKSHSSSLDGKRSPPPNAIVIPSSVAKSLSSRALNNPSNSSGSRESLSQQKPNSVINREQLEYGSLLKSGEVQMLYRSPDPESLGVFLMPQLHLIIQTITFMNTLVLISRMKSNNSF